MRTTRRFAGEYLVLVVLPVLATAAVMRAGAGVAAPPSIGGRWTLSTSPSQPEPRCFGDASAGPLQIRISQSGRFVAARVRREGETTGRAVLGPLAGNRLELDSNGVTAGNCAGPWILSAAVLDHGGPRTIEGTLGCSGCGSVSFTAIRNPRATTPDIGEP